MNKNLKFIVLILIFAAAFTAPSCRSPETNSENPGNYDDGQNAGGQSDDNTIVEIPTEDPFAIYNDGIDAEEYDFNGEEFKIQIFENPAVRNNVYTEAENGDLFNDALYKRNRTVEERFNVKIKEVVTGDILDNGAKKTRDVILAGDSTVFDLFDSRCPDVYINWQRGLTYAFEELPVIDLDKPYWNQTANKSLTINGSQYTALGKFNLSSFELSSVLLFNKKFIQDFGLENPYVLVSEGKWTFSKMEEMMKPVIQDLNSDGIMDTTDRFGYLIQPSGVLPNFWISAGEFTVGKDENDSPYAAVGNERFLTVFQRIFEMMHDSGAVCFDQRDLKDEEDNAIFLMFAGMFESNKGLFMDSSMYYIESLRSLDMDFGIIPYPKFDEQQKDYVSRTAYFMAQQVPITNTDLERAGVMLETLNSESAKTTYPVFFEKALKQKFSRDDESADMLDLIVNSLVIDLGDTTVTHIFRDVMGRMFKENDRNIVSKANNMEIMLQRWLKKP